MSKKKGSDAATSYRIDPPQRILPHTPIKPRTLVHDTTSSVTGVDLESGTRCAAPSGVAWKVEEGWCCSGSHRKYVPWSGVRHGCPSHSLRAYVGVLVSGACSTRRVRDDVGGGGELHMDWKPARRVRRRLVPSKSAHCLNELYRDEIASILVGLNTQNLYQVVCTSHDVAVHVTVAAPTSTNLNMLSTIKHHVCLTSSRNR